MYSIAVERGVNCWNVLLIHPKSEFRRWTLLGARETREEALKLADTIKASVTASAITAARSYRKQ